MAVPVRPYTVIVRRGDEQVTVDVEALSPQLAANAAELSADGRAVLVGFRILGRCIRCQCLILAGERPEGEPPHLRCGECRG